MHACDCVCMRVCMSTRQRERGQVCQSMCVQAKGVHVHV